MHDKKKHLAIIQPKSPKVIEGTTCFTMQASLNVDCQRKRCQHWIDHPEGNNCVMIAASNGPHTLQKIGQIYGLTRMRICQIEKTIFEKIRAES